MHNARPAVPSFQVGPIEKEPDKTLDAWSVYAVPYDGPEAPWSRYSPGFTGNAFAVWGAWKELIRVITDWYVTLYVNELMSPGE